MQDIDWRSLIIRSAITGISAYVVLLFLIPEWTHSKLHALIAAGVAVVASLLARVLVPDKSVPKG